MINAKIKMIVTDLDDTLLRSDKTISDYTVSVFQRCRAMGIKIVFATARPIMMVEDIQERIPVDAVITMNGSCIFVGNQIWKAFTFEPSMQRRILRDLTSRETVYQISALTGDKYYSNRSERAAYITYMDFEKETDVAFSTIAFHYKDREKGLEILENYKNLSFVSVSSMDLFDILPENVNKFKGAEEVATCFGIDVSEVVAFGDNFNDIEMLSGCGTGIAVENAISEAKAAANDICESCDQDGLAKWLERKILAH